LGKIADGLSFSLPQPALYLVRQDTAAPAISDGGLAIIEGFSKVLTLGDNGQIVSPWDLGNLGNSLLPNYFVLIIK
jgi:hypothetical protein